MTAIMDELVSSPAREKYGQKTGSALPSMDEAGFSAGSAAFKDQAANALTNDQGLPRLLYELAVRLPAQPDIQALCVWLYEPVGKATRLHVLMADLPVKLRNDMDFPVEDSVAGWVWSMQQPLMINTNAEMRFPDFARCLLEAGIESFCGVPLTIANRRIGVLGLASTKPDGFCHLKLQFMQRSQDAANVADNLAAAESPICPDGEHEEESCYVDEQIRPENKFEDIISRSASLRAVFDDVKIVAPTNSAVLILGETGTGKELIARAIHNRSSRRQMPFIKVNCAAIPSGLLESELFGHERGAFTGAIARKIGRFELANGGTLFLDEIGDIPPELQPKLLRVLQEREFERLGSTQTVRTNVRMIAATHRNLPRMVEEGKFRADLYYRLNVFPITIPPLRERKEDIPLLVRHFVRVFAERMNRQIEVIPEGVMECLVRDPWTGNIRELENFIERAVILSRGCVLEAPLTGLQLTAETATAATTLKDAERAHIISILRETDGIIGP